MGELIHTPGWWTLMIISSQTILLRMSTFLIRSLTLILTVLLLCVCFYLILIIVLQGLSLHLEIQVLFMSQFPLIFLQTQRGMLLFIAQQLIILIWRPLFLSDDLFDVLRDISSEDVRKGELHSNYIFLHFVLKVH